MRYFKTLIPTFGKHYLIMLTYCDVPKVGIKISHVRVLFLLSSFFVAVINPYSALKFLIFNYSSLFTFIVSMLQVHHIYRTAIW